MSLPNEVVLRPRFKLELNRCNQDALKAFEIAKTEQSKFIITRIDDHVFIKIPRDEQHFWSPQLHLEIIEDTKSKSTLFGLFGPSPTVWTMFMFFHFIVAGLFIGFGIWTYTNWSLGNDYAILLFVTIMMIILWFVLYFGGRIGKASGRPEMISLHEFMKETLQL